jgi:DNA-binding transcriptional MerR regulator
MTRKNRTPTTSNQAVTADYAPEYTIDELAREAGTTVRNVRAYQDRGLLAAPTLRGRTGIYNENHLIRLRLVNHLLTKGYTLGNIQELVQVLEDGQSLHDILGLQRAISSPWTSEPPRTFSLSELLEMFGLVFNPKTLKKVLDLGLLELDGLHYRAPHPRMLIAGAELHKAGLPLEGTLELVEQLRSNVERVANAMVQQVVGQLDHYRGGLPPKDDIPKLANLIWRLRPLAMMAVESEVSRALEKAANQFLGERIEQIIEVMQQGEIKKPH